MFGFGKKKESPDQAAVNVASAMLSMQLMLGQSSLKSISEGNDLFGMGYAFGFHDGVLRVCGLTNDTRGFAALTMSYLALDSENGVEILMKSMRLQSDPEFIKGNASGFEEAIAFMTEKTRPSFLANHLAS